MAKYTTKDKKEDDKEDDGVSGKELLLFFRLIVVVVVGVVVVFVVWVGPELNKNTDPWECIEKRVVYTYQVGSASYDITGIDQEGLDWVITHSPGGCIIENTVCTKYVQVSNAFTQNLCINSMGELLEQEEQALLLKTRHSQTHCGGGGGNV